MATPTTTTTTTTQLQSLTATGGPETPLTSPPLTSPPPPRVHYRDSPASSQLHTLPLDSGFPVARQTLSHWQLEQQRAAAGDDDGGRSQPHVNDWLHSETISSSASTPADDVIIGAGISGALIAWNLLRRSPSRRVVLVEARSASSGATGRNGGHCRPDSYAGYLHYKDDIFGGDSAMAHKVLANEQATLQLMNDIVHSEGLTHEVDWWKGRTFSVFLSEAVRDRAKQTFDAYERDGYLCQGDADGQVEFITDVDEVREKTQVKGAVAAAGFNAASLYPLRFTHAILRRAIKMGLQLYTHTPAFKIQHYNDASSSSSSPSSSARWTVSTPRGTLHTHNVVLATNGYSSALLPSLSAFLTPHRAQAASIVPPRSKSPLTRTYSIARAPGDYEYLVQRPAARGSYWILGGGHAAVDADWQIGHWDDGVVSDEITEHLAQYAERTFEGWTTDKSEGHTILTGLKEVHTGIQGYTRDGLPIVGECPRALGGADGGLFLDVGHHGHGMARAATVARGVAALVLRGGGGGGDGNEADDDDDDMDDAAWEQATEGLPPCFRWTEKRAARRGVEMRYTF